MDELPQNVPSSEDGTEPGVEIVKGAASLSQQQQLPTVHNLVPASTPVFSSYRSMFQGWKNSVPKLYQYPSSEIEVVVYRKNGQIGKLTNGADPDKKSNLKDDNTTLDDSISEESYKNVSHLMKNISKPLVISPDVDAGSSVSLLPEETKYDGNIRSSPSPSSLPQFPLHFNQRLDSESARKLVTITPATRQQFPGTQNTMYRSYVPTRLNDPIKVETRDEFNPNQASSSKSTQQQLQRMSAFSKPEMTQQEPKSVSKRCQKNCRFVFIYGLAPVKDRQVDPFIDNVISVENLLEDKDVSKTSTSDLQLYASRQRNYIGKAVHSILVQTDAQLVSSSIDQSVQNAPTVNYASAQTKNLDKTTMMTHTVAVQTDQEPDKPVIDFGCQNAPLTSCEECQTEPEPRKSAIDFGCQHVPPASYQGSQTEPEPLASVMEVACQNVPITSHQESQTQPELRKSVTDFACQMVPSGSFQASQTDPEPQKPVMEFGCQSVPFTSYQEIQTEPEPQKSVISFGCQVVPSATYQETQTEPEPQKPVMEFGCQMIPSVSCQVSQTEMLPSKDAKCQTVFTQIPKETQTILEIANAECQIVPAVMSKSNQTEQDILNPVVNSECQAAITTESKLSQTISEEKSTAELAIQSTPTYDSKEVQLSGSCCYFTEKRIRKKYDKTMKDILKKVLLISFNFPH